jgi:hypothetical protein
MSQTLGCLKVGQLNLTSVVANGTDVSVALLLQSTTILRRLSNHTRTNDDLTASFLERFSLAGDFVIRIFRFHAAPWQFVVTSFGRRVSEPLYLDDRHRHTFLDTNDADLVVLDDNAADRGARLVSDVIYRTAQSE